MYVGLIACMYVCTVCMNVCMYVCVYLQYYYALQFVSVCMYGLSRSINTVTIYHEEFLLEVSTYLHLCMYVCMYVCAGGL